VPVLYKIAYFDFAIRLMQQEEILFEVQIP